MARVELKALEKRWDEVVAVEPTDLVIGDGELIAILGPSGCGKSTTLFMLAGIYAPTGGEIRFDDTVVNEVEAKDRNIGIVFQSYALYPHMTARENVMFPLRFKGVAKAEARRRAEAMAELVRIGELLERKPAAMSGGQQQRVALARALVKEPQLLLLDEPLSNLDASLRLTMRSEIRRLQRRLGVTTLLVTHDQTEATTMADRIVCMSRGRIEQVGRADDLYHRPESLFVASFLGSPPMNLIEGVAEAGLLRVGETSLPLADGARGEVVLGVRPEAIGLGQGPIPARVEETEPLGRETLYLLETPIGQLRAIEPGAVPRFRLDDRLSLSLPAGLLFDRASGRRLDGVSLAEAA